MSASDLILFPKSFVFTPAFLTVSFTPAGTLADIALPAFFAAPATAPVAAPAVTVDAFFAPSIVFLTAFLPNSFPLETVFLASVFAPVVALAALAPAT
jgi:hypothetical protein